MPRRGASSRALSRRSDSRAIDARRHGRIQSTQDEQLRLGVGAPAQRAIGRDSAFDPVPAGAPCGKAALQDEDIRSSSRAQISERGRRFVHAVGAVENDEAVRRQLALASSQCRAAESTALRAAGQPGTPPARARRRRAPDGPAAVSCCSESASMVRTGAPHGWPAAAGLPSASNTSSTRPTARTVVTDCSP